MKSHALANSTIARTDEIDGLLRSLYRDLDASLIPFELAIASGERSKAIGLQSHIEFVCAAMLVIYEKKNLLLLGHLKP